MWLSYLTFVTGYEIQKQSCIKFDIKVKKRSRLDNRRKQYSFSEPLACLQETIDPELIANNSKIFTVMITVCTVMYKISDTVFQSADCSVVDTRLCVSSLQGSNRAPYFPQTVPESCLCWDNTGWYWQTWLQKPSRMSLFSSGSKPE